jgi:hypothetical protein
MSRDDIQKLLGGYATGTLTVQEREALFAAALEDQQVFDALAAEQPLKDALELPGARERLIGVLAETPSPRHQGLTGWLRRPAPWAIAGCAATAVIAVVLLSRPPTPPVQQVQIAVRSQPAADISQPTTEAPMPAPPKPQRIIRIERPKLEEPVRRLASDRVGNAAPAPATLVPQPEAVSERLDVRTEAVASALTRSQQDAPAVGVVGGVPGPAASFIASAPRPPVRYRVLLRTGDNAVKEAPPDAQFRPGESVQLAIDPEASGQVQVLRSDERSSTVLFAGQVEPGRTYIAPTTGGIEFPEGSGELRLAIVFSPAAAPVARFAASSALKRQPIGREETRDESARRREADATRAKESQPEPAPAGAGRIPVTVEVRLRYGR